jgi:hypothetical protein
MIETQQFRVVMGGACCNAAACSPKPRTCRPLTDAYGCADSASMRVAFLVWIAAVAALGGCGGATSLTYGAIADLAGCAEGPCGVDA